MLTVRHVVAASEELKLKTNDNKIWEVSNIQPFPNHDLALLTFTPDGKRCPYQALDLGDSNTVKRTQRLYKYLSKINCALLGRRSKGSRGSMGSRGRREKELLLHLKNIQINLFTYLSSLDKTHDNNY